MDAANRSPNELNTRNDVTSFHSGELRGIKRPHSEIESIPVIYGRSICNSIYNKNWQRDNISNYNFSELRGIKRHHSDMETIPVIYGHIECNGYSQHRQIKNRSNYTRDMFGVHSVERPISENSNNWTKNKRKYPMGLGVLEELKSKSPEEVLFALKSDGSGFKELLNEYPLEKDKILKIVYVISKACQSYHKQSLSQLLEMILKNGWLFFELHMRTYLIETLKIPRNASQLQSMNYVLNLIETLQTLHPHLSLYTIQFLLPRVKTTTKELIRHTGFENDLLERIKKLEQVNIILRDTNTVQPDRSNSKADDVPNDFRAIPIFPDKRDLWPNERPLLRPNIIEGRYDNVNHYLDVQFRLLREDFIRPLREGICSYLEQLKANKFKRLQDIRVYQEVKIYNRVLTNDGVVHVLQFNVNLLRDIHWKSSKRLIYGALVCLTHNNFETVYFGTVADREVENLKDGLVGVKFEKQDEIVLSEPFLMVEPKAYFEASRHILTALQSIDENSFPLKEHIVDLQKKVGIPQYLSEETEYCVRVIKPQIANKTTVHPLEEEDCLSEPECNPYSADFSCGCVVNSEQHIVSVFDDATWPSVKDIKLDLSQYNALKSALRQKLCIIQGPPGTGKTFVGLKIMETLLHNQELWNLKGREKNPILVVCYTNHALDQFLEGVLELTKKVVRMGGRSNSEILEPYTMKNLKYNFFQNKQRDNYVGKHHREMKLEIKRILNDIKKRVGILKLAETEILSEEDLKQIIGEEHSLVNDAPAILKLSFEDKGQLIRYWLGLEFPLHDKSVQEDYTSDDENSFLTSDTYNSYVDIDRAENISLDSEECKEKWEETRIVKYKNAQGRENKLQVTIFQKQISDARGKDLYKNIAQSEERNRVHVGFVNDFESDDEAGSEWKDQDENLSSYLAGPEIMKESHLLRICNVWNLKMDERWCLYKSWLVLLKKQVCQEIQELKLEYESKLLTKSEVKTEEEVIVAKNALVIGMTTTGAAKYRHFVNNIRSKIVIVEEAAEVLEAHIITSLSKYTEHLILIGDHQQLRPNPVVYDLTKKYKLEVSLYERLIKNGVPYVKLQLQHRMRPDISRLLVPHIYEELEDHPSVFDYEEVLGFTKSLYFINHKHLEMQEADSTTRVNTHEAQFLVALCRYILQQGYQPTQITILTTYLGQLSEIKRHLTGTLQEVKATVVDNFQGEENDIILLSFVRSNEQENIGFLKTKNRVCVALSRAKKGLFCIGNFELFSKKSRLWSKITKELRQTSAIGYSLELQCQKHKNIVPVSRALDFVNVQDGGCTEPCDYRLICGHLCIKKCHPLGRNHIKIRCEKPCERIKCNLKHKCKKLCFEDCGPCNVQVNKTIPNCKHERLLACHVNENTYTCTLPCPRKIPECNHDCTKSCGEPCGKCYKWVEVVGPCGHTVKIQCLNSKDEMKVTRACLENLPCGHRCNKRRRKVWRY